MTDLIMLFFLEDCGKVALVMVCYHSNRKLTNVVCFYVSHQISQIGTTISHLKPELLNVLSDQPFPRVWEYCEHRILGILYHAEDCSKCRK